MDRVAMHMRQHSRDAHSQHALKQWAAGSWVVYIADLAAADCMSGDVLEVEDVVHMAMWVDTHSLGGRKEGA